MYQVGTYTYLLPISMLDIEIDTCCLHYFEKLDLNLHIAITNVGSLAHNAYFDNFETKEIAQVPTMKTMEIIAHNQSVVTAF